MRTCRGARADPPLRAAEAHGPTCRYGRTEAGAAARAGCARSARAGPYDGRDARTAVRTISA
ncbi:hypothetical protein ACFU99_29465 [Streptomyces sp. NPDC057654]|uniref:hypothetical protein n=1 Tax=Streptomyces sp. NPDC057654 TaxID=3346196 RepID=UPI0036C02B8B